MQNVLNNTPVTTEYAAERLEAALKAGDMEEVEKWAFCIRGNNDMRVRGKHRARYMKYGGGECTCSVCKRN